MRLRIVAFSKAKKLIEKEYPYQLVEWQPRLSDVREAERQFVKYKCCDRAILVRGRQGFAIFTDGKDRWYPLGDPRRYE